MQANINHGFGELVGGGVFFLEGEGRMGGGPPTAVGYGYFDQAENEQHCYLNHQ